MKSSNSYSSMGIIFKKLKKNKTRITPQRNVVQKYMEKLFLSYPSMPPNYQTGIPAGVSFLLRGCCKVCFHCLHTWRFLWNVQDFDRHVETSSGELLPFWPNYIFLGIVNTGSLLSCNPAGLLQEKFTTWVPPPASLQSYPKLSNFILPWNIFEGERKCSLQHIWRKLPDWEKGENSDRKQNGNTTEFTYRLREGRKHNGNTIEFSWGFLDGYFLILPALWKILGRGTIS